MAKKTPAKKTRPITKAQTKELRRLAIAYDEAVVTNEDPDAARIAAKKAKAILPNAEASFLRNINLGRPAAWEWMTAAERRPFLD